MAGDDLVAPSGRNRLRRSRSEKRAPFEISGERLLLLSERRLRRRNLFGGGSERGRSPPPSSSDDPSGSPVDRFTVSVKFGDRPLAVSVEHDDHKAPIVEYREYLEVGCQFWIPALAHGRFPSILSQSSGARCAGHGVADRRDLTVPGARYRNVRHLETGKLEEMLSFGQPGAVKDS